MDLGPEGRRRTIRALAARGMDPIGYGESPFLRSIGGRTVAFICLSLVPGKDGGRQPIPDVVLSRKLRMAGTFADRVVVFMHWGTELRDWPDAGQIEAARWLVGHGADLILGAHPHVVQAPACVEGKPVFYSLGNHLFDQKYPQTRKGLIADCALGPGGFACRSRWTAAVAPGILSRLARRCGDVRRAPCSVRIPSAKPPGSGGRIPWKAAGVRTTRRRSLETRWSGDTVKYRWTAKGTGKARHSWESRATTLLSASAFTLREKPGRAIPVQPGKPLFLPG